MADTMTFTQHLKGRLMGYYMTLDTIFVCFTFLPATLLAHPLLLITSPATFRDHWFARSWLYLGPGMASNPEQNVQIADLLKPNTHGVVLELGPGGGDQLFQFTPLLQSGAVTKVYGIEPNELLHPALLSSAKKVGFKDGQYVAVIAGAEPESLIPALQRLGLLNPANSSLPDSGLFNTIITIKTLCSFSEPKLQETLLILHALLVPGGKLIFWEHLGNEHDVVTKVFVWFAMWLWPISMGGCRLDGRLDRVLRGMSDWKEQKWVEAKGVFRWSVFRWISGWVAKA